MDTCEGAIRVAVIRYRSTNSSISSALNGCVVMTRVQPRSVVAISEPNPDIQ